MTGGIGYDAAMTSSLSLIVSALLSLGLFVAQDAPATQGSADGVDWKQRVLDRAGIEAWDSLKRLQFTFNVERPNGQTTSVQHDWNLETGVDTVTWDGQTVEVNVWNYDAASASEQEKAAFRRWTNDSYWLLAPLKIGDPGVNVETLGPGEMDGQTYNRLGLSFDDVGLTPGDRYVLYVDDEGLVRYWDYMPSEDRKVTWAWTDYEDFGGLTLATRREPQGDGSTITFTDVSAERR